MNEEFKLRMRAESAEKRLVEVTEQYKSLEKDWSRLVDEVSELEARDHVAYMNAVAERETRRAEGRIMLLLQAIRKAKKYGRVTGADNRTEITLVFQERDYQPIREALNGS